MTRLTRSGRWWRSPWSFAAFLIAVYGACQALRVTVARHLPWWQRGAMGAAIYFAVFAAVTLAAEWHNSRKART